MSHFSINGHDLKLPESLATEPNACMGDFLEYVRKTFHHSRSMIACIRVDGSELDEKLEQSIYGQPLESFGEVTVETLHPSEFADQTIQTLKKFSVVLETICAETANAIAGDRPELRQKLSQLAEGLDSFHEGLLCVRKLMNSVSVPAVDTLEADLLNILRDFLDGIRAKKMDAVETLLRNELCQNLRAWRERGLVSLERARDC